MRRHFCNRAVRRLCVSRATQRGTRIKAALFKCLNKEKCAIMVCFESNKQTQKCYVTKWVKRNAVIKEGALPLFRKLTAITTGQPGLTFSSLSCLEISPWSHFVLEKMRLLSQQQLSARMAIKSGSLSVCVKSLIMWNLEQPHIVALSGISYATNGFYLNIWSYFFTTVIRIWVFFFAKTVFLVLLCGRRDCHESLLL